jgi:hypothetical protein
MLQKRKEKRALRYSGKRLCINGDKESQKTFFAAGSILRTALKIFVTLAQLAEFSKRRGGCMGGKVVGGARPAVNPLWANPNGYDG